MSEQDMKNLNSNGESYHNIISTEMLEDICDTSQTNHKVNKSEAHDKIRTRNRLRQLEWKGALKAT